MRCLAAFLLLLALAPTAASQAAPRRVLTVSLYPFIPEPEAAALQLKQGFEALHPDVIVRFSLNPNYYSRKPEEKGLLYEDADIHEIDVVLLRDLLDRHRLQPASPEGLPALEPLARQAATRDGTLWAVPQWMCSDFLFFREDEQAVGEAHTLEALRKALPPRHGLLLNLDGEDQLGELYLSSVLAETNRDPDATLAHLGTRPDPAILARFQSLLAMEPPGLGRNPAYGLNEGFYARQFARRTGGAFVGYSEMMHEVQDESRNCRVEEHCVTASQMRVAAFPWADGRTRPVVWVDMFGIDAKVHGQALADARAFIRYAVSLPAYRSLLIPSPGHAARSLLPATRGAFDDPEIVGANPLYPALRAIMEQGVVVAAPHLTSDLHRVAAGLDAALPKGH